MEKKNKELTFTALSLSVFIFYTLIWTTSDFHLAYQKVPPPHQIKLIIIFFFV